MSAQHTPTPWIAGDDEDSDYYLVGPDAHPPSRIVTHPVVQLHNKANAFFIVQCVNAHDELVNELRVARAALADFAGLTEPHAHSLARRFADSIAKATGAAQ